MSVKRYVVDSNVLIGAPLSPKGSSRRAVERVIAEGRLLFSQATFDELVTRLMRPKFDKWVSRETRLELLEQFVDFADWVEIDRQVMGCRDPHDDKFLETARCGHAEAIISGDTDLLALDPFDDIPILAPGEWP